MRIAGKIKEIRDSRRGLFFLGIMAVVAVLSICIELFVFNYKVFLLPSAQKGERIISMDALQLEDLKYDKESGIFHTIGESPAFLIKDQGYISYLRIIPGKRMSPMHISMDGDEKSYDVNPEIKKESIIDVKYESEGLRFRITADDDTKDFAFDIEQLIIDNTIMMNWLRVLLIFSIGILLAYFVLFYNIVGNKIHITFCVLAITIGINMALMTPQWYVYDEREHFIRAYELGNFDLELGPSKEISWIENIDDFFFWSGSSSVTHNSWPEYVNCLERYQSNEYTKKAYYHSTAITYPFVPYLFNGLGIMVSRLLHLPFICSFFMGRIFGLMGYVFICYLAIKYCQIGKRLMFLIALFPMSLYSASGYSADPMTLAFSLLSMMLFINMLYSEKGMVRYREILMFAASVSIMSMCKITYAPFCVLALCISNDKFKTKKTAVIAKLSVFGIVGIVACLTMLLTILKGMNQWHVDGVSVTGQIMFILSHLFKYISIMASHVATNAYGYFSVSISTLAYCGNLKPIWSLMMILSLFVLALIDSENKENRIKIKEKGFLAFVVISAWGLVLTALYLSFTPVGNYEILGVQGRYFAPLILPALLLLKNKKIRCEYTEKQLNVFSILNSFLLLFAAVTKIFTAYCA